MPAADADRLRKVAQWLAYAEEDLRLARHAMTMDSQCPCRLVAYHAQQCAEKHLKAYLVMHGVDFPYTHNLGVLLERCAEHSREMAAGLDEANELTPYAITTRYPGEDEEVDRHEAESAIEVATRVRRAVRQ